MSSANDASVKAWPYTVKSTRRIPSPKKAMDFLGPEALAIREPPGGFRMNGASPALLSIVYAIESIGRARVLSLRPFLAELCRSHAVPEIREAAARAFVAMADENEIEKHLGLSRADLAEACPLLEFMFSPTRSVELAEALMGTGSWKPTVRTQKKPRQRLDRGLLKTVKPGSYPFSFLHHGMAEAFDRWGFVVRFAARVTAHDKKRFASLIEAATLVAMSIEVKQEWLHLAVDDDSFGADTPAREYRQLEQDITLALLNFETERAKVLGVMKVGFGQPSKGSTWHAFSKRDREWTKGCPFADAKAYLADE